MNLSLQDPFAVAKEFPETLTHTLLAGGHSVIIQFNYKGDYLASGLSDGSIVVYDLASNGGVVAHLQKDGHIRAVTSLCWSRCGRYLLSSSQDWSCKLWDLSRANSPDRQVLAVIRSVRFDGPIWLAVLHPSNPFQFTASLYEDNPVYVDTTDEDKVVITTLQTQPFEANEGENSTERRTPDTEPETKKKKTEKHMTLVTTFEPRQGKYIFTGTSKGWLNIISSETLQTVHSVKIANSNIKNLVISSNGRKLAINSSDRVIRQINLPDFVNDLNTPELWQFEVEHKYQDVVNRLQWNSVAFNHNAEFLVASTFGQSSQDLYVWETSLGSLVKILEGSNEELIDVKWNYSRCMIGSTGLDSGCVYLWLVQFPQKWSALAPDFVEIEENIEYDEKEDEFDIVDDEILVQKRLEQEEDLVVDITTMEKFDARGFDIEESFVIPVKYE